MNIYRDEQPRESTISDLGFGVFLLFLFAYMMTEAIGEVRNRGVLSLDGVSAAVVLCAAIAVGRYLYRRHYYRRCAEIRLSDDGRCDLETKRGTVRLHVNEIESVKYRRGDDGGPDSYTIRYRGGRVEVTGRMTRFRDFLVRLRQLNPGIDLSSSPAEKWPDLALPAPPRTVGGSMRSALFPSIVFVVLAWLAFETLTGS
jgi:hypothetical protein